MLLKSNVNDGVNVKSIENCTNMLKVFIMHFLI